MIVVWLLGYMGELVIVVWLLGYKGELVIVVGLLGYMGELVIVIWLHGHRGKLELAQAATALQTEREDLQTRRQQQEQVYINFLFHLYSIKHSINPGQYISVCVSVSV